MASFITIRRTACLDAPGRPEFLTGTLYATENKAHRVVITALRGGAPEALTGSVTAYFIRPDQATVFLTGGIEDGAAVVDLAQSFNRFYRECPVVGIAKALKKR